MTSERTGQAAGAIVSTERIGQAAGALWKRLHDKGPDGLSITEIKKLAGFTPDETLAGLGWLAREGKLSFRSDGKKQVVCLVGEEILV